MSIRKIIQSPWSMAALLAFYAVTLGVATFVENGYGTATARELFYNSWWMFVLQGLLCINFVAMASSRGLWRGRKWGVLMLHYGFVVILVGAMTSHLTAREGVLHIRQGESSSQLIDERGNPTEKLPFAVTLERFTLERYGGSGSPSAYKSDVVIDGARHQIYMNNVLSHDGWRFYQSSFDTDELGSYLLASADSAGTTITYIGYVMLAIGMVLSLMHKNSRFRRLIGTLSMFVVGVQFSMGAAVAAPNDPHIVNQFERLMVQSGQGRVQAVGSYAEDLLRKIARQKSINGASASEVLLGITTDPYKWSREKFIRGIDGMPIAFVDVIGPDGAYLLSQQVEEIYHKPARERTKSDKEILKLDERINILDNLFTGRMLALFPVDGSPQWHSSGDDLSVFEGRDSLFVSKIFGWFADQYRIGNHSKASEILDMIATYQNAKGGELHTERVEAEILYNRLDIFKWGGFGYMGVGLTLIILLIINLLTHSRTLAIFSTALVVLSLMLFLWQSFGLGVRWYISQRAPWTNAYESMVYVSWASALAGIVFLRRSRIAFALAIFLAGVLLFVSNLSWMDPTITPLVPVLNSYWLIIHVAVITASYGFFAIGFLLGVSTLILLSIRGCDASPLSDKIHELTVINTLALTVGLVLLTAGTFLGAVWANESWGRYWGWDPKETWALVTVVVYSFVLHMHFIRSLSSPYALAVGSVVALGAVLMTFFGVNYYLSGMHSYGSDSAPDALTLIYVIYGAVAALSAYAYWRSRLPR